MNRDQDFVGVPETRWGRPVAGARREQARTVTPLSPDALRHPALTELLEAWNQAAAEEGLTPPSRRRFHPQEVRGALGRLMIADREATPGLAESRAAETAVPESGHTYRYRLVGTQIVEVFGQDFTGETIEIFHPSLRRMTREQFDAAFAAGGPIAFRVSSVVDHLMYDYEKLILPVRTAPEAEPNQAVVATFQVRRR